MLSKLSLLFLYVLPLALAREIPTAPDVLTTHARIQHRSTLPLLRRDDPTDRAAPPSSPGDQKGQLSSGQVAGIATAAGLGGVGAAALSTKRGRMLAFMPICLANPARCVKNMAARGRRRAAKEEARGNTQKAAELRAKVDKMERETGEALADLRRSWKGLRKGQTPAKAQLEKQFASTLEKVPRRLVL